MLSKMKTIQEFLDHKKRVFKKQVEERKKEDKRKVELCKSRFARSIEMMDEDTKKTFYHPSQEPTIGAMKAFYLEIYPVLDEKLDETEAERFPLLWNYLFDEVINHSFSMTLLSTFFRL